MVLGKLPLTNSRQKMKWKLSPAESTKLVYYFVKLLGLAPFTLKNNRFHPPTPSDLLYPVAMAVANLFLMIMATFAGALQVQNAALPQSTIIWNVTRYLMCLPATLSTLTSIILSHKKILHLLNKLCTIRDELETLGIKENAGKLVNDLIVTSAIANAIIIAVCVTATLLEPNWPLLTSIKYYSGSFFNFNVLLIFVQILFRIRQRFQRLNERLSNIFVRTQEIGSSRNPQTIATRGRLHGINEAGSERLTQVQLMRKFEALHLEHSDMVRQTADIFAIPILLNSLQFFSVIVLTSQWMYSVALFGTVELCPSDVPYRRVRFNICSLINIAIAIFEILMIAYTTTTTCQEVIRSSITGNSTEAVLIKVWNDSSPPELEDEFFMFSIQLTDNPVAVSAFGLFRLDYSYVYKIFGATVTYLIIVVQFDIESLNKFCKDAATSDYVTPE